MLPDSKGFSWPSSGTSFTLAPFTLAPFTLARRCLAILLVAFCPLSVSAADDGLTFALVPKLQNVPFFHEVRDGCMDAAKNLGHVQCLYKGPETSDFRLQDRIVSRLVDDGVDGIALSVINSPFQASHGLKKARDAGIPVITFDSDLDADCLKQSPGLRKAYVGTDNRKMGQEMAKGLMRLNPSGVYAILSGNRSAPNLNSRIQGIQEILAGTGWTEFSRSPLFLNDSTNRALTALDFMHETFLGAPRDINAVIVTNASLQASATRYRQVFARYSGAKKPDDFLVISADASPHQITLLQQGFSDINIGQHTYQMGQIAIDLLYRLHKGLPVKEINYTSLKLCEEGQDPTCRLVE